MDQLTEIWLEAQALQRQQLSVKEQETMEQVDSYEHLCERLGKIQTQYQHKPWVRLLARMDPFVSRLRSFAAVLSIFAQAKPEVLSLVWGSIALVLECYVEDYVSPSSTITHLRDSIRRYYQELIDQCQDYIRFLKSSPLMNFLLLGSASRKLRAGSTRRLKRLRHLSMDVEQEARVEEHRITYRTLSSLRIGSAMASVLPYHGVTYRQNPAFFARPHYLEQISAKLDPDTPEGLKSFALVGFGGCGKTQLAIEYAHKTSSYDAILWCAAENSLRLSESFTIHARALNLIKSDDLPKLDRVISLVKQRLLSLSAKETPSRWLMIFDNMEVFDGLSSFWPSGLSGSILVTTRNKTLAKEFTKFQVSVAPFSPLDARLFLLQYRANDTKKTSQEDDATTIISQRLGNLPLALDLVRHHVLASGSSYKEFLEGYGEPSEPFLFDKFSSTLDTVVSELMDGSLVDRTVGSGSLSLHRILQDSVAHSFDISTRSRSFNKVLFFLNGCFPVQQDGGQLFEWWCQCEEYVAHIVSAVRFYKKHRQYLDPPIILAEIIRRCAWYLWEKHQFEDGKSLVRDAVAICKEAHKSGASLGFTHDRYIPRLLSDLYNVMGALEYESNTEGHGLKWAWKARSIRQELCLTLRLEDDVFMLQVVQNNIATDMLANGQPQEALPLLEAIHEYDISTGGINPDNFYRTLNLSICYQLLGKYFEAINCSNIAVKVVQEHIGEDTVAMATARFYRGNLLLCMDDRVGAFDTFSRCFLTRQKLMPTHFDTAFAAHKLGDMTAQNRDLNASM
ncbi:hypothetical protein BKA59DRAFT_526252 [Fusarium tricinctum]|uniref:NB-ARC domain-containing protein n=1 Tax=Fusarium tricinctum TaxID=61284 RepID=A0A8K0S3V9_9HYPO|nr:hypothetical protein BKA59DRAFT_526252 [Fusarium tricinctum]